LWAAAGVSAGLLELPFPLAGPMPPWRSVFAWFGLVPLLWALLSPACLRSPRPTRSGFLVAYFGGVLWYMGNCYWVRNTMMRYGDMPTGAPTLLLIGFSLVLGLYWGLFGLGVVLVRQKTGSVRWALAFAPFLWAALELAAARITSVPWDQLGYSQVDNGLVNQLAPWTGVYGISFLLVYVNAQVVKNIMLPWSTYRQLSLRLAWIAPAVLLFALGSLATPPKTPAATATAVLIQPNLDVGGTGYWQGPGEWSAHFTQFTQLAEESCGPYLAGIPQTGAPTVQMPCASRANPDQPQHPDLVAWPESPAPFVQGDPRLQPALASVARAVDAPLVVGGVGTEFSTQQQTWRDYNSALIESADGQLVGRYDKIHLVPFGEYIPFQNLLTFAHKLTGKVSSFTPGTDRRVFHLQSQDGSMHRYGVFICYEAVFADEVRQFARNGAEVLVNISDDGWYGDTSAPWQHFNMARMRAIENRRWLLRDTNTGVTAVIDPYGVVRESIPRHQVGALAARFGFRDDVTFYTQHGDVFAWVCVILSIGVVIGCLRSSFKPPLTR
jgi:apolipoprotein N-acyltransferase